MARALLVKAKPKSCWAEVSWEEQADAADFLVTVAGGNTHNEAVVPSWRTQMRIRVKGGTWYKVRVEARRRDGGSVMASGSVDFKSVFDREELLMLYDKCVQFAGTRLERFQVFYRHKPKAYWDNIAVNRNHIMEKYIKDLNGQVASPINDVIYGLFFSANLLHGRLPSKSPFGDLRMLVSPPKLFTGKHRLYFADFYCNYVTHYLTVVVCVAGSETDEYCSKALVPLDPTNNPFLKVDTVGLDLYEYWVNSGIWVEVFYTENVPTDWAMDWQPALGTGKSKPGGLANNKYCPICNLYPRGPDNQPILPPPPELPEAPPPKRRREEEAEVLDVEEPEAASSTFHRVMEFERRQQKKAVDAPPNLDVLDLIFELVDSVIAEVGPRIPVPQHGLKADVKEITLVDLDDEDDDDIQEVRPIKSEASSLPSPSEAGTPLGKELLEQMAATNRRLNEQFKALGRMLTAVQESIATLERKARTLPKLPV